MMSYFNRNKWITLGFILLVTLNIATLTAFWLLKERPPGPPDRPRAGVTDFLVNELGFDSMQKQKLEDLVNDHRREVMDIRRNIRAAKDSFFALLKEPSVDDAMLARAAATATAPDQQMDMITFRHFQQVRQICNDEQKRKFDNILQDVLRMNAPPPNAQGPPPGVRDGHPPGEGPPPPRQ
jgi:protein CpxP